MIRSAIAALLLVAASAVAQPSVKLPPDIDRVLRDYERAWRAHDAVQLASLFAEDGWVLSNGRPPVHGRDAIRGAYANGGGPLFLRALAYRVDHSAGYIVGAYGSEEGIDSGKFVLALRRVGERWLIASDIDNSNRPRGQVEAAVTLSTIPTHVYKVAADDKNETLVFNVLVHGDSEPYSATAELFSGDKSVETVSFTRDDLVARRATSFKGSGYTAAAFASQDESYDLRHEFTVRSALKIDRITYRLRFKDASEKELDIPVTTYTQKTKLIFPVKGLFTIINGWVTDRGHTEWSQYYAYDITPLDSHLGIIKTTGETDGDYYGWGREVLAPAAGVVTYARNDVPDNPKPGAVDVPMLAKLPDAMWAAGGNCVVIDHGNGEFSFLAHMQHGSVRVKKGDHLDQGAIIGLVGASGVAFAPHLHYHLMAGPTIFRSDPLPSRFENTDVPTPRRGQYIEAK